MQEKAAEQKNAQSVDLSDDLIKMKNEFAAAAQYFKTHPESDKYSRKIGGIEHSFIKVIDVNNNELILARMQTLGAGAYGKTKRYVNQDGKEFAVKTSIEQGNLQDDKEILGLVPSNDPELDAKGQKQLIGTLERFSNKRGTVKEYVVMEFATGKTLSKISMLPYATPDDKVGTKDEKCLISHYPEVARYKIFLSMIRKAQKMHNNGVIHLDIKSDNTILARKGGIFDAKFVDFGISRQCKKDETLVLNEVIGTSFYSAPEMQNGEYSAKSDVFSLGKTGWADLDLHDSLIEDMMERSPDARPSLDEVEKLVAEKAKAELTADDIVQIERLEMINQKGAAIYDILLLYSDLSQSSVDQKFDANIVQSLQIIGDALKELEIAERQAVDEKKQIEIDKLFNETIKQLKIISDSQPLLGSSVQDALAINVKLIEIKKGLDKESVTAQDKETHLVKQKIKDLYAFYESCARLSLICSNARLLNRASNDANDMCNKLAQMLNNIEQELKVKPIEEVDKQVNDAFALCQEFKKDYPREKFYIIEQIKQLESLNKLYMELFFSYEEQDGSIPNELSSLNNDVQNNIQAIKSMRTETLAEIAKNTDKIYKELKEFSNNHPLGTQYSRETNFRLLALKQAAQAIDQNGQIISDASEKKDPQVEAINEKIKVLYSVYDSCVKVGRACDKYSVLNNISSDVDDICKQSIITLNKFEALVNNNQPIDTKIYTQMLADIEKEFSDILFQCNDMQRKDSSQYPENIKEYLTDIYDNLKQSSIIYQAHDKSYSNMLADEKAAAIQKLQAVCDKIKVPGLQIQYDKTVMYDRINQATNIEYLKKITVDENSVKEDLVILNNAKYEYKSALTDIGISDYSASMQKMQRAINKADNLDEIIKAMSKFDIITIQGALSNFSTMGEYYEQADKIKPILSLIADNNKALKKADEEVLERIKDIAEEIKKPDNTDNEEYYKEIFVGIMLLMELHKDNKAELLRSYKEILPIIISIKESQQAQIAKSDSMMQLFSQLKLYTEMSKTEVSETPEAPGILNNNKNTPM